MVPLYWLLGLVVLLVIEIATLGLTTIWFAGGALVAFFAALLGAKLWLQLVLFVLVSLLMLIFTRPVAVKYLNKNNVKTNYEGLIGKVVRLTKCVDNASQTGQAVIHGVEWTVRSTKDYDIIEAGKRVKIVNIEGAHLIVEECKEEK